ncbi:MAG: tetratricopeptide repeat protein [Acidobacteriaceae bacterium]
MDRKMCRYLATITCTPLLLLLPAYAQPSAADKLIADGHYLRAEPLVQAALAKSPQDVDALIALSSIQWSMGELDAALASAQKAVLAADGSAAAHAQMVNILGAKLASSQTGDMERFGLARRFRTEVDRTFQLEPNNLYALEAMSRFYWYAPFFGGGDKAKARHMADRLVQLNPIRGYALKAELDADEADPAKCTPHSQADWKQAVAVRPDSYRAYVGLGLCQLKLGGSQVASAAAEAKKAIALDPTRIAAYKLAAATDVAMARWDALDADLHHARTAVPEDLGPEYMAAQAILDRNIDSQLPRAERYLQEYLGHPREGLEPDMAKAHWELGLLLEKQGHKQEAIHQLQAAMQLDPWLDGAKKDLRRLQ